jgi:uncharacterized YccA/Bax inhibitor family protein
MANPFLNDASLRKAADAGWAAPDARTRSTPIDDGPSSPWTSRVMTVSGTVTATGVLFVLLLAAATAGWLSVDDPGDGFPPLAFGGIAVGFACVIALYFRPAWAKFLAPVYALAQGFVVGVVSKFYESVQGQEGIVVQAVGATLATFLVMLVLYRTKIIKVTDRFRRIIIGATMGVMLLYLVSFVVRLIAGRVRGFLNSPSAFGIGFSVFVCGLAAMNLAAELRPHRARVRRRTPKGMEWYAAFGLLVTIVWLYLEILRLLSKLNRR